MRNIFFTVFIFLSFFSVAQKPDQLLESWSARTPIEKVHLHFDRENFIAGETTWFKAYLYSDYLPDTISTILYTELSDQSGKLINRYSFPVILGIVTGQIDLPETLSSGNYQVRSYTPAMLNMNADYTGRQNIFIYGRNPSVKTSLEKRIQLEFFPEGGNLLSNVSNMIAFKAIDENGLPVKVKGKIYNSANKEQLSFDTYHDGMGMFELTPLPGEKYYAIVEEDALANKFSLPGHHLKAIAVSMIPHPEGFFFEIKQNTADPTFHTIYMVGQMQHHTVFRQEFKKPVNEMQGLIQTRNLRSGILHVTFFNKDHQPLAERLCFINNKEYIQPGNLLRDTISFSAKGKNRFSIQLPDTVQGSFSISVTDADYELLPKREENIYSSLLLTGDLRGNIHNPAWYFSGDTDSIKTSLDLVMMTNGWRRFKWEELPVIASRSPKYKDPAFITLEGRINLRGSKKPFDEKALMMMLLTEDSTRKVEMLYTNKQGQFRIDSMLFFGKSKIMFADIRGKKSEYLDVKFSGDTSLNNFSLPALSAAIRSDKMFLSTQSKYVMDFDKIYREKGLLMEGVTVKARKKKSPLEILDEKYASGAFATDARKVFDLVNTDESKYYNNVLDFLRAKGFSPTYRTQATLSALGEVTAEIYLDEFLTNDETILETLPMSRIAMIKIYSTFSGTWGSGPGGAIAIYTKQGEDLWNNIDARPTTTTYNGFSVMKEFYAPDYSVKQNRANADTRITLDWRPDIRINHINPKIPFSFYNNDRTKSFKIVVEGMTTDGKMLLIEEVIK